MDIRYTETEARNVKKLDGRTQILVHLGIEPDSKTYRMLDPVSRKIIVSRDVIFEEDRRWKWRNLLDHETMEKLRSSPTRHQNTKFSVISSPTRHQI